MAYIPLLVVIIISIIFFLFLYYKREKKNKENFISKKKEENSVKILDKSESDLEFNERIKKIKSETESKWRENSDKKINEKRNRYFALVDKQINQIILNLKNDIEKDARGENFAGTPFSRFEYDVKGEDYDMEGYEPGLLTLPIIEFFQDNLMKRDSYKKLQDECIKFNMKVEIKNINIGYLDPNNYHPLEPTCENYKIIIKNKY